MNRHFVDEILKIVCHTLSDVRYKTDSNFAGKFRPWRIQPGRSDVKTGAFEANLVLPKNISAATAAPGSVLSNVYEIGPAVTSTTTATC